MRKTPIIYYHSIQHQLSNQWFRSFLTLNLNHFEWHLKLLHGLGYETITLEEYFEIKYKGGKNKKKVLLTFDDGYLDNYVFAYPLLKKYGFIGTVFVNTDYIDRKTTKRMNLEDYWSGRASLSEIQSLGFLNPDEMRFLESTGVMRIESHTKTHDKYPVSDKIIGFHYPGRDCLYPIAAKYPEQKPYYIGNSSFEQLLPFGTPFFEEESSVIAKKVKISADFRSGVVDRFQSWNFTKNYDFDEMFFHIRDYYDSNRGQIIESEESDEQYLERLRSELVDSKEILEKELGRKVNYLCWPHGDTNDVAHAMAKQVGYLGTTVGKSDRCHDNDPDRIHYRTGLGVVPKSKVLSYIKSYYKLKVSENHRVFSGFQKWYEILRYGRP